MDLNIRVSDVSGATVVSLAGDIGPDTVSALAEALDHLCEKARPVMVDLAGITRIDGLGLSVLAQAFRRLRQHGCALIVVAPPPGVRKIMDTSGVGDFLPICRTLDEASALVTVLQRHGTDVRSPTSRPAPDSGG